MSPIVFRANEGTPYKTKDASIITEIFHPNTAPGLAYSLAEARVLPGKPTIPHLHEESAEIYYVLEGTGRLYLDQDVIVVNPDDAVLIPPGTRHSIEALETPLRFLCLCSPPYDHDQTVLLPEDGKGETPS